MDNVWIFNGDNSSFPAGVFLSKEKAEIYIEKHKLSGVLTQYPTDNLIYNWAIENNIFSPKKEHERTSDFIQRFTSASQEHYHYENGVCE